MSQGIRVVGLGPGAPGLVTRAAWEALSQAEDVYLRTGDHPIRQHLPRTWAVHTFDELYEKHDSFERVYRAIVQEVFRLAQRPQGVVYAVPGDPSVGEATVQGLRAVCQEQGLPFRLIHGLSFVEPCLALLGLDALDGLSVVDALQIARGHHPAFPPHMACLIGQLYSRMLASDVKLTLLNQYPEDHAVALVHGAGLESPLVERMPLHEMDRSPHIGALTALYVSPADALSAFEAFQETVAHLRAPEGCPWDREQTHQSLRPHLLEEVYEALEAIDRDDMIGLREELGDMLLQVVLQAQIATDDQDFRMGDVVAGINDKLIRRHPHVFAGVEAGDAEQVLYRWDELKASERRARGEEHSALAGVPAALPALAQAAEMQSRAARLGFDWPKITGVLDKVHEELEEVAAADAPEARAAEVGDLLFAAVNYARWLDVDPEAALRQANQRFRRRFQWLETRAQRDGRDLKAMTLEELDALWQQAKQTVEG